MKDDQTDPQRTTQQYVREREPNSILIETWGSRDTVQRLIETKDCEEVV